MLQPMIARLLSDSNIDPMHAGGLLVLAVVAIGLVLAMRATERGM